MRGYTARDWLLAGPLEVENKDLKITVIPVYHPSWWRKVFLRARPIQGEPESYYSQFGILWVDERGIRSALVTLARKQSSKASWTR